MGWLAQITGHAAHADAGDAREAETDIAAKLRELAAGLTGGGHEGVAATFTGDHVGSVNLLAAAADANPQPEGDALGGDTPQPPAEGETQPADSAVADGTPVPPPGDLDAAGRAIAATPPAAGDGGDGGDAA